jgi:hypothetical protein
MEWKSMVPALACFGGKNVFGLPEMMHGNIMQNISEMRYRCLMEIIRVRREFAK